ncbi:MAG: TetR/AcrR family transcriptional regulator [Curvibacter sp.]|nr:MAG: TetR/AcrR family transcriptional regulator [Curvibacter sp.]
MKVTKEQAQQNRQALLEAAGRLFKKHGIDGIGVADVSREAGLTPGALYKHFVDKQDLAAQAFSHAFRLGFDRVNAPRPEARRSIDTYLRVYLSPRIRDDLEAGCPLIATACETGRQGEQLSQSFADAFVEFRAGVESVLPETGDAAQRAALASLFVAAFVGANAISRGVVKADRDLADEVLDQIRSVLVGLAPSPEPTQKAPSGTELA